MNIFWAVVVVVSSIFYAGSVQAEEAQTIEKSSPLAQPEVTTEKPKKKKKQPKHGKIWTIDKIVARVNGTNLLLSDLEQPHIAKEGSKYTQDEAIVEELFYQKAAETHMLPSALDIERQLVTFKIQNNLTELSDQDFADQLKHHGFTVPQYKKQLGRLIAVENIKRVEISEKIIVTTQEVEAYYKKHPEYAKEEYLLKTSSITQEQLARKDTLIKDGKLEWEDLGWVAKKDIGKKFASVFSMKKGDVSEPIKTDDAYQLVQLVDKKEPHLKTLTERYGEIEKTLQQGRKDKFIGHIEKELKEKASVELL